MYTYNECYECGFNHGPDADCEKPRTILDTMEEGHINPIKTKGVIHWHDSKTGDGMVKVEHLGLVRFVCLTVSDLSQGEKVPVMIHYDTTFIQAEIDTAKL